MLGKYIKFNNEVLPNPVSYNDNIAKILNSFQSEAGDDLVITVRNGKYTGNFTFNVSSFWKDKLLEYFYMSSFLLTVNNRTYIVRMEEFNSELVANSESSDNTDGFWVVTFSLIEY